MSPSAIRKHSKFKHFNPVLPRPRQESGQFTLTVFHYTPEGCKEISVPTVEELFTLVQKDMTAWINMSGTRYTAAQQICDHYGIDPLLTEDILSTGQRAKMDEIGDFIYCLVPMLDFNKSQDTFQQAQVNIIVGKNLVLSFQDDPALEAFNNIYSRLRKPGTRLQNLSPDYLCYILLDTLVDNYFLVMEKLGEKIEEMQDLVPDRPNSQTLYHINQLRREMLFLRRTIGPVREVVNGLLKSDSELIGEHMDKYFKNVYDHVIQANELAENYQEMMINMQDLYLNNMDLRMNEVMKVLTIVTTLVAPPTLIAGIYGMNFRHMPELETRYGYFVCLGTMVCLLLVMLVFFRRKGWF